MSDLKEQRTPRQDLIKQIVEGIEERNNLPKKQRKNIQQKLNDLVKQLMALELPADYSSQNRLLELMMCKDATNDPSIIKTIQDKQKETVAPMLEALKVQEQQRQQEQPAGMCLIM